MHRQVSFPCTDSKPGRSLVYPILSCPSQGHRPMLTSTFLKVSMYFIYERKNVWGIQRIKVDFKVMYFGKTGMFTLPSDILLT